MPELVGGIAIIVVGLIVLGTSVNAFRRADRTVNPNRSRFEVSPIAQAYVQLGGAAVLLIVGIIFTIVGIAKG